MDNEAPKYASWVPEAGGYVANGKVVSESPQYDEGGKLKLDVDASLFTPQQVATSSGVSQANAKGSKTDVNSNITATGSLGSLNINTSNPLESAISSPSTKSPIAETPILSMEDQINKEYQDAAARGDYQGMINALVSMGNHNGQDYSAEIDRLTRLREDKIRNIDDQFLASYNQATMAYDQAMRNYNNAVASGDEQAIAQAEADLNQAAAQVEQVVGEQNTWREQVGYKDAMQVAKQRELEDNTIRWTNRYLDGVDQIAGSIMQLVGSYLNFQYDPMQDQNLLRAQAHTELIMRNNAAATGMYYSSTTQYAVAQALAELVPVYEKMAKDEIKDSINMLQSTANFLINLEEAQFDMWRAQIQLQFDANAEKRAEIDQAIQNANARGYYTNEEAAKVGVAPGSLSQKAREHEQELIEKIEEEKRKFQQQLIMADYNQKLQLERMEEENRINKDFATFNLGLQKEYWQFQVDHPKPTSSGGSGSGSGSQGNYTPVEGAEGITQEAQTLVDENGNKYIVYNTDFSSLKDDDGEFDKDKVKEFVTKQLQNITDPARRRSAVADLKAQYIEPMIDDYATNFSNDYGKTTKALKGSLKDIEEYISWFDDSSSGIDRATTIETARDAVNYLSTKVNDASNFDHIFADINTDANDNKEKGFEEIEKYLTKSGSRTLNLIGTEYVYPGKTIESGTAF